jgi:hypothetical protein
MSDSYDLTKLDPASFEHLVNLLALRVLGAGQTGFGPGADGGRDGYYEGEAPYPSDTERWSGVWYIQSKFLKPHISRDPQKWLLERIKEELAEFQDPTSKRVWPDNWIIATNIDPSGTPMTGAFDRARSLVSKARPELKDRFHIWGGRKVLDLLVLNPEASEYYQHFLTPGHVLTAIYDQIKDSRASVKAILHYLIAKQFGEQQHTKLEQAGSPADTRPGIHRLFIDLPFRANEFNLQGLVTSYLVWAAAKCHRIDVPHPETSSWERWHKFPSRARVWFIKGGPGQGKSTIGQYFCQIQRAALILQKKDAPRVLSAVKTTAVEIQKIAERAGFWPLVPRVPIYIELKDYAQWLGRREKDSSRGILTYLAWRISVNVQEDVPVGMLKRLLQTRSWFVVFDGLDEVPSDVKDIVALEVQSFLDDSVVEVNADLLTICTSRPQGYSGQFSGLDGPTIDLINLTPERALECAKPVIELERSEGEAQKSFDILKSAIQSSSIRELMATPLQSHIMAVVVRDGGRPPERRWQLYTNFYQVIKRREANRELPDKRLSKLLREEDLLLKTVHSRLGFVLHAKAETSQGAQTHLDRSEFKDLVTQAVSQMVGEDIENIVDTLMEATTDRLVLVSTPDSGNHVRFHIRPLQEFFAAEFLYESVDAEELGRRIEIIAGDSHWREVMHFLLSALIENNRKTELSVSIQVLEHLNEGDGEPYIRLLRRRLGRGALLTARLLQEGVLEQDMRVRQQFRKCLEPLTAFITIEDLQSAILIEQPKSKSWLLDFLVDSLHEANITETIGAAIVLSFVLPDDDVRVEKVRDFLLSAPPEFISHVLELRTPSTFPRDSLASQIPLSKWFVTTTLRLLVRPQWDSLSAEALTAAINILGQSEHITHEVTTEMGLRESYIQLLSILLEKETGRDIDTNMDDYGVLKGQYVTHDWTTNTFESTHFAKAVSEQSSDAPGILQLIFRVLRFGETRRQTELNSALDYINGREHLLQVLPTPVRVFLPLTYYSDTQSVIEKLRSLSEEQFETLINEQRIGSERLRRPYKELRLGFKSDLNQWEQTVETFPTVSLDLWSDSLWDMGDDRPRPAILDELKGIDVLINKLLGDPVYLQQSAHIWGKLLNQAQHREADLRRAFMQASSMSFKENHWTREFHPFKLNLPLEAPLLPYLLDSIISYRESPGATNIHAITRILFEDVTVLATIFNNDNLANNIRLSAVVFSLLYFDKGEDLKFKQTLLLDLFDARISTWYLKVLSFCLLHFDIEQDQETQSLVGKLIDLTREDYKGRKFLQGILTKWRERSQAPVRRADVQHQWLAG